MTGDDLKHLKRWFDDYAKSFYLSDEKDQRNIILKIEHTRHVCENIVAIASGSHLDENTVRIAETTALFHDLGRFSQYAKYRTFRDADSMNHGLLGSKILREEKVLGNLPEQQQQLVISAVKFHNAYAIPTVLSDDAVLILKLIRDADKVDIFRVFIEYYETPEDERAAATAFGVPDTPEYSESMLASLSARKVASYSSIKTENDFKLMKLSWVYDMNFNESLRLLQKRNYINSLIKKLPQTKEIKSATINLQNYISERLSNE